MNSNLAKAPFFHNPFKLYDFEPIYKNFNGGFEFLMIKNHEQDYN